MADMPPDGISTSFADKFTALHTLPAQDRQTGYQALLSSILSQYHADDLQAESQDELRNELQNSLVGYAAFLLQGGSAIRDVPPSEPLGIIAARPLLATFISSLKQVPSADVQAVVVQRTIDLLAPRQVSFEDSDTALKYLLADVQQQREDFLASAKALQAINLDTTQRSVSDTEKAQIWVRTARCYLEEDDTTSAMIHVNRAKNILHNVESKELRLQFSVAQARILDSRRQFLDASSAYHNISFEPIVDEDDRLQTLSAAIICAVLAPAGPQRARLLARLYKDDRAAQTDEYAILEKIFLDRLLSPDEVAAFASKLKTHQLAKTSDDSTVLDHAVLQHNLLGASKLYRNIRVDHLGVLLGVDGDRAESYAAQMIEQGRLRGHIDQIDGVIYFEGDATPTAPTDDNSSQSQSSGGAQAQKSDGTSGLELRRWDAAVHSLLAEVENVTTMIQSDNPSLYAAHIAS